MFRQRRASLPLHALDAHVSPQMHGPPETAPAPETKQLAHHQHPRPAPDGQDEAGARPTQPTHQWDPEVAPTRDSAPPPPLRFDAQRRWPLPRPGRGSPHRPGIANHCRRSRVVPPGPPPLLLLPHSGNLWTLPRAGPRGPVPPGTHSTSQIRTTKCLRKSFRLPALRRRRHGVRPRIGRQCRRPHGSRRQK
jgi:hypothetical protein